MNALIYHAARIALALFQCLPLRLIARLGQALGWIAFHLDRRHRRIALENMGLVFSATHGPEERLGLVRTHFLRLGENYACALKTAGLSAAESRSFLEVTGLELLPRPVLDVPLPRVIVAIGHFGNFEVYAKLAGLIPHHTFAATYRGIRPAGLDRLLRELREKSGCRFYERRQESGALKSAMQVPGLLLGLLVDQHAGDRGLRLPFLGVEASTNVAPALFALRYDCLLVGAICYRVALARWRIEFGPNIPTREPDGTRRAAAAITADINTVLEQAIRRDPANWFWVHRRWKPAKLHKKTKNPASDPEPDAEVET